MNTSIRTLAAALALVICTHPVYAADVRLPAPVLEWSFYLLLLFAVLVTLFVYFKRTTDKRKTPLSSMIDTRSRPISTVRPDAPVTECVRLMESESIGSLLVMEDDQLLGIFTERDALTKVLAAGIDPIETRVSEVMTRDPKCVDPSTTVEEAMGIITSRRFRHLPIVHNGQLVGLVSSGDLTYWLVEDQELEIRELVEITAHHRHDR
jgi:CBS domain-containing protein